MKGMIKVLLLVILFLFLSNQLVAEELGKDIYSFMIQIKDEMKEEYLIWLQSRVIYETSIKYRRSVEDVMTLYDQLFLEETPTLTEGERIKRLGFEKHGQDWYFEGERLLRGEHLFAPSDVVKAYREINFGDSRVMVQEKLKQDLNYRNDILMPEIQIGGEPFILTFSFYEDQLFQILIQHKETRFVEDLFKFADGLKYYNTLQQVISSQYGEPSFFQELTFSLFKPPYDARVAWGSIWGPEKTGGEKRIRIGINYVSFKATLSIDYLPLLAKEQGIVYVEEEREVEEVDRSIKDSGKDF